MDRRVRERAAEAIKFAAEAKAPHERAIYLIGQLLDGQLDALGVRADPVAWCEGCGQPFFDGDKFWMDADGASGCLEGGPCLDPDPTV